MFLNIFLVLFVKDDLLSMFTTFSSVVSASYCTFQSISTRAYIISTWSFEQKLDLHHTTFSRLSGARSKAVMTGVYLSSTLGSRSLAASFLQSTTCRWSRKQWKHAPLSVGWSFWGPIGVLLDDTLSMSLVYRKLFKESSHLPPYMTIKDWIPALPISAVTSGSLIKDDLCCSSSDYVIFLSRHVFPFRMLQKSYRNQSRDEQTEDAMLLLCQLY